MFLLRLSLNKSSNLVLFDPQLLWGTKEEIQSIPLFKWFSLLLVPVPNSSPGSSQCLVPVIVICLPEPRGLSVETFTNNRRFLMVFSASHSCSFHTSGYLVPNRRPFPYFFDNRVDYLCGIDCTSSRRGWTSGMRESGSIDKKEE
ncbi:hypothetical protein JHK85_002871 [Glycine max]|nr:hypothetical protein JHK85_002871 [Glycine max]